MATNQTVVTQLRQQLTFGFLVVFLMASAVSCSDTADVGETTDSDEPSHNLDTEDQAVDRSHSDADVMIADVADMTADVDAEVDNEMDVAVDLEMDAVEFDVAPDVNDADGEEAAFSCESDERRCSADRFQECNGDRAGWSDLGACLEGAVCIQGECVFLPDGYGDSCGEGDECPGDLLCSESICLSRVAGDIGDSCLDSLECEQPLWCNGLGQCTTGALDSPCAADSDCAGDAPLCEAGRICGQNTPPIIQTNGGLTLPQGAARTIGPEMLTSIDDEHGPQSLVYSITVFPTHGTMRLNGNEIDGGFTQSELDSGLLS